MISIVNVNKSWGIGRSGDLLVNIPEDMRFFRTVTAGKTVIMGRKTLESFPGMKPLKGRINVVLTSEPLRLKLESIAGADKFYIIPENILANDKIKWPKNVSDAQAKEAASEEATMLSDIRKTAVNNIALTKEGVKASEKRTLLIAVRKKEDALALASYIEEAKERAYPDIESTFVIGGSSIYRLFLSDCEKCLITKNNSELEADSFFPNLDEIGGWQLSERGAAQISETGLSYEFDTYLRKTAD